MPLDLDTPIALVIYTTRVTLVNRQSGDEVCFDVRTLSDRFSAVMDAIKLQKAERKLKGYEIFDYICLNPGF